MKIYGSKNGENEFKNSNQVHTLELIILLFFFLFRYYGEHNKSFYGVSNTLL